MDVAQLKRFGELVRARRLKLGRTIAQAAAVGDMSEKTLGQLERAEGHIPSLTTLGKVDVAVDWKPGSAVAALHGNTPPKPLEEDELNDEEKERRIREDMERRVREDVERQVRFELALKHAGVAQAAARNHIFDEEKGYKLSGAMVDALIELLYTLPPSS
ncbi:helix-turn-helix domain-containing protein [Nocardia sp. CY41]|uniref:helix-turn-helix domain-containing protein n=1 Tax=Nocardia sp. CY41 TaxID=2608686 RepID=UPI00135B7474|nr:helix-turn-helix transcriptional regulator [Nocardia sp. CY41]